MIILCSLLVYVQGVNAQFLWQETHPSSKDRVSYDFHSGTGISSYGDIISVMGYKFDSTQTVEHIASYHAWRSEDDGKTWEEQNIGLPNQSSYEVMSSFTLRDIQQVSASHCVVVGYKTEKDSALYLHTFDGGKTWSRLPSFDKGAIIAVHFLDTLTGVVAINNGANNPSIYTTSDGGKSFLQKANLIGSVGFYNAASYGNEKFRAFQAGTGRVFSNLNLSGDIDSTSPIPDVDVTNLYWFQGCEFSGDTIIAYGYYSSDGTFNTPNTEGIIARSSDGGKTWSSIQHFPQFYMLFSGTIPNRDTVIVAGGSSLQKPMYVQSIDNGYTWRIDTLSIDSGSTERIEDIDITGNGTPVAITRIKFAGDSPTILARGKRTPSSVGKGDVSKDHTTIYPNPATTSINIHTPNWNSSIKIVDMLGRIVLITTSSLNREVTVDVSNLPRGVYHVLVNNTTERVVITDLQ